MCNFRMISATVVFLLFEPCAAQEWVSYTSMEDRFRVLTWGEVEVRDFDYPSEYGAVFPARIYSFESDRGRYSITVVDYTEAQQIHQERTNRTEACASPRYWEIDVRASIAFAASKIRERGGDITYDAYHHINLIEGHQLQITNPDQSRTFAAIYLHDSRLYVLEATVPAGSVPPGLFQQSLEILDEEGSRIRYEKLSEVIKVRGAP